MANARDLRLQADYDSLRALADASDGTLHIETAQGSPPDQYVIAYRCRSIAGLKNGKPVYASLHRVRIKLPSRYPLPSAPPRLEMLTPIYNPHVYPNQQICLGDWHSSEYLDQLALRVGALIQFDRRIFDLLDPANPEAMSWVLKNMILLPTDECAFGAATGPTERPDALLPLDEDSSFEWIDHENAR